MRRPVKFAGFDIEATGSDFAIHKVIQVGCATASVPQRTYVADIGWAQWVETEEAMKVNGFTRERILAGRLISDVDKELAKFLTEFYSEGRVVPVGWNVGSFDMTFIRPVMPLAAKRFGYQSVDLNAICFTLSSAKQIPFDSVKTRAKDFAATTLRDRHDGGRQHDALYDAKAALLAWEFLFGVVQGEVPL